MLQHACGSKTSSTTSTLSQSGWSGKYRLLVPRLVNLEKVVWINCRVRGRRGTLDGTERRCDSRVPWVRKPVDQNPRSGVAGDLFLCTSMA